MDPRTIHPPTVPAALRLRSASPGDAPLLRKWRAEASVRRFQPLADVSTAQLRADLANQHPGDLYRGHGDKFQWIVLIDEQPAGWLTLVTTNWQHGLAEIGYALAQEYQGQGWMAQAIEVLLAQIFFDLGLSVEPDPQNNQPRGHCLIPQLSLSNFGAKKNWYNKVLDWF